jgi:hypothetical protein
MQKIPSWETNSSSASQNILHILWNKIGYILEWWKFTTFINHNIILPSMPMSSLAFRFLLTSILHSMKETCVTCQPTIVLHGCNFKSFVLVNAELFWESQCMCKVSKRFSRKMLQPSTNSIKFLFVITILTNECTQFY